MNANALNNSIFVTEGFIKTWREALDALQAADKLYPEDISDIDESLKITHESIGYLDEYGKEAGIHTNDGYFNILDDAFRDFIVMPDGKVKLKGNLTLNQSNMLSVHRQSRL